MSGRERRGETMDAQAAIFIVGNRDIKERALVSHLKAEGYSRLLTANSIDLDVLNRDAVDRFFKEYHPGYVIFNSLASPETAMTRQRPAEHFFLKMLSQTHVIDAAYRYGSKKLLYVADSDVYPRQCPQPMRVEYIATGPVDPRVQTNAVSQIAGISMCQAYRKQYNFNTVVAVFPPVYGPWEEADGEPRGFLSETVAGFVEAAAQGQKRVRVAKNPDARREFLFSGDFARACEFLMHQYDEAAPVNIGSGVDIAIREAVDMAREISGFEGEVVFEDRNIDEDFQRLLDADPIQLMGWMAGTVLREGLVRLWESSAKKGLLR